MEDQVKLLDYNDKESFVVVGSGIAGLYTAISLADRYKVTVISKQDFVDGNTWFAQGGIAAAFSPEDSPLIHFEDTWLAGSHFGNREAISMMVEEAPARINDLSSMGVVFDNSDGIYDLGCEGAHSQKRILHIGGDATGRKIIDSLLHVARKKGVSFIENAFVEELIVDEGSCHGLVYSKGGKLFYIGAIAVILASGGCGQYFQMTTNAPGITGDGLALAYKAGAVLKDLEFFQFHPTVFIPPDGQPFLISEAVRGEGAYLINKFGDRFMYNYTSMAELGPRDIVSRAIVAEQKKTSAPVHLDLRHLGADFIKERFPTIFNKCLQWDINLGTKPIPVAPAAHYLIGGVEVDLDGQTAVENLYAVGEVASSGVHGANRLASNSLLEGLVFGFRVAEKAKEKISCTRGNYGGLKRINEIVYVFNAANKKTEELCSNVRKELQKKMWEYTGLVRSEEGLNKIKSILERWIPLTAYRYSKVNNNETKNMIIGAMMIVESAFLRRESRGCHYRLDYPQLDEYYKNKHISFKLINNFKDWSEDLAGSITITE